MTETILLCPGGPHPPDYTRQVAWALAECVRVLNHATGNHAAEALSYPSDAASVVGAASTAAERLPQLLDQLSDWLARELAARRLHVGYGPHRGDPAAAVAHAGARLRAASAAASQLHQALSDAAAVTSAISAVPGSDDEED